LLSTGSILANGVGANDIPPSSPSPLAGGGSGGGIFLHSHSFVSDFNSLISAHGGAGADASFRSGPFGGQIGGSGGGGGGRVDIETDPSGSLVVWTVDVSGGAGGRPSPNASGGSPGNGGQIVFNAVTLPEPASVVMLSFGLAAVAGLAWRRRKAKLAV
jgi:hypothetical protein